MKGKSILDTPVATGVITFFIIYSVVCFSIETLPDLSESTQRFLDYSEIFVISIFTLEYLYRVYVSEKKMEYICSFYGMIDLIAIAPFYLFPAIDMRTLRLVRLFRLVRIFKLVRYNNALHRFGSALQMAKEELIIFISAVFILIYFSAFGIYHFEHAAQPEVYRSIFDALWWSVSTLTTVGYGDIYPVTVAGRMFTFAILLLGLGLVTIPAGIIASALSAVRRKELGNN